MFANFREIQTYVEQNKIVKTLALAGAHDHEALSAVVDAKRRGYVNAILVGNRAGIEKELAILGEIGRAHV